MLKVLVVDDDISIASMITEFLAVEGYATVTATEVETGWSRMLTENPDAAIIDLWFSGRQAGWTLVERIREAEAFRDFPIVIITGASESVVEDRARALHCELVAKPFSAQTLADRLQRVVHAAGRLGVTRTVAVQILTNSLQIDGKVHIPADLPRFSDAWEAVIHDQRLFVPVTEATLTQPDRPNVSATAGLWEVQKSAIVAVRPTE